MFIFGPYYLNIKIDAERSKEFLQIDIYIDFFFNLFFAL